MRQRVEARIRTHQRGGSLPAPNDGAAPVVELIVTANLSLGQDLELDRRKDREFLALLNHVQVEYQAPLVIAGNLFSGWRGSSPATLNFALDHLPRGPVYAVPGPEDMGLSGYADLYQTAFATMIKSGRIRLLEPGRLYESQGNQTPVLLRGFPHTFAPEPTTPHDMLLDVAVVSAPVWVPGKGAGDPGTRARSYFPVLKGFQAVFFGGNPVPFTVKAPGNRLLVNCGGRNVHLLYSDGTVKRHGKDSLSASVRGSM